MAHQIRTLSTDQNLVEERRRHIAKCAIKVFCEKGYKATTMRELARICGMAQGAIYYYIGAKEDILHLIISNAAVGGPLLRGYLKELGTVSNTEALVACVREYYRWADTDQDNYLFFNREMLNFSPEDRNVLLKSQIDIIRTFEELLVKGTEAGEFLAPQPLIMAHNIVIQGFDWAMRRWYLKDLFTLQEYTDLEIGLLMKQLGVQTT